MNILELRISIDRYEEIAVYISNDLWFRGLALKEN